MFFFVFHDPRHDIQHRDWPKLFVLTATLPIVRLNPSQHVDHFSASQGEELKRRVKICLWVSYSAGPSALVKGEEGWRIVTSAQGVNPICPVVVGGPQSILGQSIDGACNTGGCADEAN
jgi:hypothetical protein